MRIFTNAAKFIALSLLDIIYYASLAAGAIPALMYKSAKSMLERLVDYSSRLSMKYAVLFSPILIPAQLALEIASFSSGAVALLALLPATIARLSNQNLSGEALLTPLDQLRELRLRIKESYDSIVELNGPISRVCTMILKLFSSEVTPSQTTEESKVKLEKDFRSNTQEESDSNQQRRSGFLNMFSNYSKPSGNEFKSGDSNTTDLPAPHGSTKTGLSF